MEEKIKVLILEDLSSDAELAEREIKAVLNNYKTVVTDTEQGFIKALENFKPDLIISDYMLPAFTGMKALQITLKKEEFIPFIILTGSMNEETAVECMKAGADDYVIKEHIKRLGSSIINALDKKKIRQEHLSAEQAGKQAAEALKESEEKYRKIFENVQDIFYQVDTEGNIIEMSPSIKRYSGYSREELIGTPVARTYYNPNDRLLLMAELQKKGEVVDYEIRLKTKSERLIYVSLNAHILYDENKKPAGIEGSLRDITERKLAEEALKENEERFRLLTENTLDTIWSTDQNFNMTFVNNAIIHFLGYSPEEIIGLNPELFTPKEGIKTIQQVAERLLSDYKQGNISQQKFEIKQTRKDGKLIDVEITANLLFNDKKEFIGFQGRSIDITERKLAEKELRESEANLNNFFNSNVDFLWVLDEAGNIITVNNTVKRRLGYKEEELAGESVLMVHPPHLREIAGEIVQGMLKGELDSCPIPIMTKDGNLIPVETYINSGSWNSKPALFGVSKDISELKLSEEKFAKAFHNNPAIVGLSDLETEEYIEVNQAFYDILGFEPAEVIGRKASEVVKLDKEIKDKIIAELKSTGSIRNKEGIIYAKNGRRVDVLLYAEVIQIQDKKYNFTTALDITERKQADEALKTSLQQIEMINANTPNIIWKSDIDDQGNFINTYISEVVDEFLALPKGTINNSWDRYFSYVIPDYLPQINELFKKAIANPGQLFSFSYEVKKADGKIAWFTSNGRVRVENNKLTAYGSTIDITERKQAEDTILELKEFNESIVNNLSEGVILESDDGIIKLANPAMLRMLGYKEGELVGEHWKCLVPEDQIEIVNNANKRRAKGESDKYEMELVKKDGERIIVLIGGNPYINNGVYTGLLAAFTDITERKHAEIELTKLSTAVTQSPSVITIADTDGNLEYVNPKFTEITGYSLEEAIGQNSRILKSGEQSDEMYKELWETISSGKVWHGEFHNKRKNGEFFWEMALVSPIFDEQGKIINYIKVAEDITKQKRNEQIQTTIHNISNAVITSHSPENFLTLVKEELGKLIDTTNFFVAIYDEETDSVSLPLVYDEKDRVEALKTYPAGKTLTHYVIKTGKSLLAKKVMIEKLIKSGEVEQVGHLSEVWLGVPLKNKKKVIGIFAVQSYDNENAYDEADVKMLEIISDQISLSLERLKAEEDLKLAKEKAEESDRLKSAFLANMSHEIRTPMNGILGFTQLLKEPQLTEEELDQYIQVIERSGMRMLNTINDIIDISKIEAGQVEVVKSEVIVNKLLEEQYNFFQNEAQSKGLELIYKPSSPDNDLRMITDQQKLAEILTNLIKNAIKFTKVGSITFGYSIKTMGEKNVVEFYVKDTGIGIPANKIEAIFNRFEQADIEDTRAFEGSGLGLTISKCYVEMLGGEIGVNSKEGEGSTFTFYIPYIRQNLRQKGTVHNKKEELEISLKNLSVIVVEDDETSRIFSEIILKNQVKRVSFVTTGKEMIEKLRETPDTDIILMDIELPDMNGYGVMRKIRKLKNDVIIIAQTAFDLSGDKEKALEAGCDDYICKPIKKEILFKKILTLLDKKSI